MNTDYLTDEARARLRAEAEDYAAAVGWSPELAAEFGQYHVNRNEAFRNALTVSAQSFRVVKEMDLPRKRKES